MKEVLVLPLFLTASKTTKRMLQVERCMQQSVKCNAVPPEPYRIVGPSMSHGSKEALEQHDSVPRLTRRTVSTAPGRAESQASASAGSLAFSSHAIADGDVRQRIERASSDAVEALIKELHGMDVVELLRRLKDTEENVTNGIKGGKKRDLSVKPDVKFTKKRKGAGVPAEVISEKEERASPFKRLVLKVKHWKESFQEHFSKSKKDGFAEPIGLQIPPPPEDVDPHDYLLLAIHYHETDNLQLSVYYLEKSAKEGNPVGLHLLGMCLRHGWGIEADIVRAVKCFVRSTEAALATFIDGWNRMKKPQEDTEKKADLEIGARGLSKHSPTAPASRSGSLERQIRPRSHSHAASIFGRPSQVPQPSIAFLRALSFSNDSHPISQKRSRRQSSSSMASSRSQSAWSISRLVTRSVTLAPDLPSLCEIIHQVLPLPLYELAQTFMHHLRSPPAAFFYLSLAAQAGDVDAVIEVAEAFEHGRGCKRDKRAAAFWYRRAAELGREVFGTGWIWKEKWA
ncbi:hypothetical protein BC832DRAFT_307102 [Gaertneriomyces semiglobifer]|nr:hypothetical protein BC832DRAFT_307102 [Gaertneriomyces semiglobifer]